MSLLQQIHLNHARLLPAHQPRLPSPARAVAGVLYDVALGGASARHVCSDDNLKEMWETLIKKRVDAVAEVGGEVWCCEVKPLANMAALGQALTYTYLWNAERRSRQKARAVVICSRVDEDLEAVFIFFGVLVIVVSPGDEERGASLVKVFGRLSLQ